MSIAVVTFAIWVILVMPLRAWVGYQQKVPLPSKWFGILQNILLIVALWLLLHHEGVPPNQIGLENTSIVNLLLCTILSTGVVIGLDIIALELLRHLSLNRIREGYNIQREQEFNSKFLVQPIPQGRALITFVPLCLVGATWEELCFRGVALYLFRDNWLEIIAMVAVSSLIFGTHHLRQGVGAMIYSSFYGVLFSILYLTTQSLPSVIVAHACGNLFVVFYVAPRLKSVLQPIPTVF